MLIFGVLIAMHMTCGVVHAREIILQCVLSLKSCLDTLVYYGGVWLQHIAAFSRNPISTLCQIWVKRVTAWLVVTAGTNATVESTIEVFHRVVGYLITLPSYCRLVLICRGNYKVIAVFMHALSLSVVVPFLLHGQIQVMIG